jgi:3-hydroxyisobutyrate dehydrogenase-like beta-hydroxyacid dehydrogenase
MDKFPKSILPRTFDYGFTNGLMDKDVRLCLAEAKALNVPMRVGEVVGEAFGQAVKAFGADKDFTTIIKVIEQRAGVEVRGKK